MSECIFVTGASGFVGTAVIEELLERGYRVNALANRRELPDVGGGDRVHVFQGGMFDDGALNEGMHNCAAVIHLVGIIMERPSRGITFQRIHYQGTRKIVDAAQRNGVKRYLQMSALGVRPDAVSEYHKTKYLAEQYLRASGLDWTIFRPSMIHGPRGEFMRMEAAWARGKAPPFIGMPYFGAGLFGHGGAGKIQPVYVKDVARAFVDSLTNTKTNGEVFPLGGADVLKWPQMHRIVARAIVGRDRLVLPLPVWWAKLLTAVLPGFMLPFNRDQVIMSQEDNTCDLTKVKADFGWEPQGFEAVVKTYAAQLTE